MGKRWLAAAAITFVGCLAFGQTAKTATQKSDVDRAIDLLFVTRSFDQVAISPDGSQIAWVEMLREASGEPSLKSAIYVADTAGAKPRQIIARAGAAGKEREVVWSPDSTQIAFLSDAASPGQLQLYVAAAMVAAAPKRLTNLKGFLADPRWSPDGKSIALLFTESAPREAGPLQPMTPDAGVIQERIFEQRITMVDVASGHARQLSPADMYIYEYDWSPDSKNFVATAAKGEGDANWWMAQLYIVAADNGAVKSIYQPKLQMGRPRWSHDGKWIAFISGIMSDEDSVGGDVFVAPAQGGDARNLTEGMRASAASVQWVDSGKILVTEIADGGAAMATISPGDATVQNLWSGAETIASEHEQDSGISLSRDGKLSAVIRNSFHNPPEIWAGEIGGWKQITHANEGRQQPWGEAKSIHWVSDARTVQGWLLYPRDYQPGKKYPMVVWAHGGPAGAASNHWPSSWFGLRSVIFPAHGYFLFYPNPRGSYGAGEEFTQGNVKDFGGGDLRDILRGVDEVVRTQPVDDKRVGLAGWSYGGFMAMWAITQSNRFRAAVAGAGICNWESYYGLNDIDQWMIPYFGASIYDDPAVYDKVSALRVIKNAKTPTLILTGDRDGEVPAEQSKEFWHALKTMGVATQLVVYPNEGHRIQDPAHRRDLMKRMLDWFDKYMPAE